MIVDFQHQYDPVGNRLTMADATGITTYAYDFLDQTASVVNPDNQTIGYAYDPVGNRSAMIPPGGGTFAYVYDQADQLVKVINPYGEQTTLVYDAAGRQILQETANGVLTTQAYDAAGQLTNIAHQGLAQFAYAYDRVGNRTSVLELGGDRVTYAYDALYQLIKEQRSGANAYLTTYAYDQVGNRTELEETVGAVTTITSYVYDVADQLTSSVSSDSAGTTMTTTYGYDSAGNLLSGGGVSNQWSVDNRLVKVTKPGNIVTSMAYNADGLRVRKEDAGGVIKSLWDFQNVLLETDGAGALQAVYTLAPRGYGILLSQRRGATSHFALYDALGSVIGLTNSAGALTDSYRYKAYGSDLVVSGSTVNPFRWVGLYGYYYDAGLGTYYIRARHYHLAIARWLSRDRLGYAGSRWNLYEYVGTNPTTLIDPSGLDSWDSAEACFDQCQIDCNNMYPGWWQSIQFMVCRSECKRTCKDIYGFDPGSGGTLVGGMEAVGLIDDLNSGPQTALQALVLAPKPTAACTVPTRCFSAGSAFALALPAALACEAALRGGGGLDLPRRPPRIKREKWKCTSKARNWAVGTPCYGQIFVGIGSYRDEAYDIAFEACVDAGCNRPGQGGDCGHITCFPLP